MPLHLCETCGTQYAETPAPPEHCPVCEDERQYVGWNGQRWTTHEALARKYTLRIEEDAGLLGLSLPSDFAIPQRALHLPTDAGRLLWECISLVTDEAVTALKARGGVDRMVISHPHFYTSMVEWSEALGGVPILLHEADREWVRRPSANIRFWSGDVLRLSEDVTLIRCGGHFPGSTALHWKRGRAQLHPDEAERRAQHARAAADLRLRGRVRLHVGPEHPRWRARGRGCLVRALPGGGLWLKGALRAGAGGEGRGLAPSQARR